MGRCSFSKRIMVIYIYDSMDIQCLVYVSKDTKMYVYSVSGLDKE